MGRVVSYSVRTNERWEDVGIFFKSYPQAMAQLLSRFGSKDIVFESLTVKGLLEAVGGDVPTELANTMKGCSVQEWCELVNGVRDGIAKFVKFMEQTTPPVSPMAKKMSKGVLSGNIEESVLMTLKTCYSLHGLEDAQKLTVYEYMIARKEVYNEAVVAYNQSMAAAAVAGGRR